MLTRVFVSLALVAGLAVILLTQFMIRPHVQQIIDTRDQYGVNWTNETRRANKLTQEKKELGEKLVATESELKETKISLENETARANQQEQRANGLQTDLTQTQAKLLTTQQNLAAWDALGLTVDQVRGLIASEKDLRQVNAVLKDEKVILMRENARLAGIIKDILGPEDEVPLPAGTRGMVLVVDPKWRFVVLDLGEAKGVSKNGVLMVSRDGKLVAKVKIMTVYSDRCIANVMPGWDLGEIMEGDLVISSN